MARSKVYSTLAGHIHDARCHFNTVMTLEAERDTALYEAIAECALGIRLAIKHPKVWDDEISQEYGWSGMRSISTQFLAVAASTEDGELSSDSKLSKDRRATYANAAMWLVENHNVKDGVSGVAALREIGGIENAAAQWKGLNPQGRRVPRSPDTPVFVVWKTLHDYEVFLTEDEAFLYGDYCGQNNEDYDITEERAGNFDLSGHGFTIQNDGMISGQHVINAPNTPDRHKDANPGTVLMTTRKTPIAPGWWQDPFPEKPASQPAAAQQPAAASVRPEGAAPGQQPLAPAPTLHQECLELVRSWLASNPPAAEIRAIIGEIRLKMGLNPYGPNEQPGATLH